MPTTSAASRTSIAILSATVLGTSLAVAALAAPASRVAAVDTPEPTPQITPPAAAERPASGAGASQAAARVPARRPNIVLITADDAAVGDLAHMPYTRQLLMNQGTTMTDAVAPTPICVPARASILTGQYARNHGAVTIRGPRGGYAAFRDSRTLPVALRSGGYDTLFVGKYLNGYDGRRVPAGWSDWRATVDPSTYGFLNTTFRINGRIVRTRGYSTDVITHQTKRMLQRQHTRSRKPFFMWVNYVGPHHGGPTESDDPTVRWPGTPRARLNTTYPAPVDRNRFRAARLPSSSSLWEADIRGNHFAGRPAGPSYKAAVREEYQQRLEALQSVDRGVRDIVQRLRRNGDLSNTYVMFSGDNGYLNGQHNKTSKLVPYDDSLRIPLVIRGPQVPRGVRSATTVGTPDLGVTMAAMAGRRIGRATDGVDFRSRLTRPAVTRPIPISGWKVTDGRVQLYRGIRFGDLTYFEHGPRRTPELYDRRSDPGELVNIARRPEAAQKRAEMAGLLRRYGACAGSTCPKTWSPR